MIGFYGGMCLIIMLVYSLSRTMSKTGGARISLRAIAVLICSAVFFGYFIPAYLIGTRNFARNVLLGDMTLKGFKARWPMFTVAPVEEFYKDLFRGFLRWCARLAS